MAKVILKYSIKATYILAKVVILVTMASNKMLSRDVKRRIQVITTKLQDLQKMGVPCVFTYATSWTGSLYVIGEDRMAKEVQSISTSLLKCLSEVPLSEPTSALVLPHLPGDISSLNFKTLSTMLVGLGKDLSINWKGEAPSWWPEDIPFQHPRDPAPENFKGM